MTEPSYLPQPVRRAGGGALSGPWSTLVGVGVSALAARPRLQRLIRLGELLVGVGYVLATVLVQSPEPTTGVVGVGVSAAAWMTWILCPDGSVAGLVALAVLGAGGGVCAAVHASGILFSVVAAGAAAFCYVLPVSVLTVVGSIVGFLITDTAFDSSTQRVWTVAAWSLAAVMLGVARRQLLERGRDLVLLSTAERQTELARQEAQLVSERNRLGYEIHDVLAHTLGSVSIQLTALEARVLAGDGQRELQARISGLHDLIGEGLAETRDAVRALSAERLALGTQITRLCRLHGATLSVDGRVRPLPANGALAVYRVVQEALTNAAKHAPQAPIAVVLAYAGDEVEVTVDNGAALGAASPIVASGGGNGLTGMIARVGQAGGRCVAGPRGDGWRVQATVPITAR